MFMFSLAKDNLLSVQFAILVVHVRWFQKTLRILLEDFNANLGILFAVLNSMLFIIEHLHVFPFIIIANNQI